MISIATVIIQIQAVRTSLLLSTFSPWQHEERHTNHKSLRKPIYADPQRAAHLVGLQISASRDPNWSNLIRSKKLNRALQRSTSTLLIKILKFSGHLSRTWRHSHSQFTPTTVQPHFLSGGLLWQMMIFNLLSTRPYDCTIWLCIWTKRH